MTPEELKAAEEKKAAEDKRIADARAAIKRERDLELSKLPVVIIGGPGAFTIDGPGLGEPGRLTIGGIEVPTTRWEDRTIRGSIPEGLKGDVVITTAGGLIRKGVFPHVAVTKPAEPVKEPVAK